jgi:hypothetical protein
MNLFYFAASSKDASFNIQFKISFQSVSIVFYFLKKCLAITGSECLMNPKSPDILSHI